MQAVGYLSLGDCSKNCVLVAATKFAPPSFKGLILRRTQRIDELFKLQRTAGFNGLHCRDILCEAALRNSRSRGRCWDLDH